MAFVFCFALFLQISLVVKGEGEKVRQLVHCGKGAPSGLLIGSWILSAGLICTAAARSARSGEALWGSCFCFAI